MLILVAGVTGNLGKEVGQAVLNAGHQLRGLSRSPENLPPAISEKVESFITINDYDEIPALDTACTGVNAVICCYSPQPILSLDGQLLLLRAAERAGIKRFHAASWNLNWSGFQLGQLETYDPYISFYYQARLTSDIKPLFVACGVLAMTFFAVPRAGALEEDKSFWVRKNGGVNRKINVLGTGTEKFDWCTEADAAAFSVALVTSEFAEKGGFYEFCSETFSLSELKETYLKIYPDAEVEWNEIPVPVEQFRVMADGARREAIENGDVKARFKEYIGFVYVYHMLKRIGALEKLDADKFPGMKRTGLEEYIRDSGIP
jgi:nucleoside-diphosphate-sugar epimerase